MRHIHGLRIIAAQMRGESSEARSLVVKMVLLHCMGSKQKKENSIEKG
jgi:hypothetical protein